MKTRSLNLFEEPFAHRFGDVHPHPRQRDPAILLPDASAHRDTED